MRLLKSKKFGDEILMLYGSMVHGGIIIAKVEIGDESFYDLNFEDKIFLDWSCETAI